MVAKALYNKRRELGLCPMCGKRRDDGWIQCSHCRAIKRKAHNKNLDRHKQIHTKYRKMVRKVYVKEGRCRDCGSWELSSKTLCAKCREYKRVNSKRYRIKQALISRDNTCGLQAQVSLT